jgi:integrase/recombinase XerC
VAFFVSMHINTFIQYITNERRYSPHTVLAYTTDLQAFAAYLEKVYEVTAPTELTVTMLRSYVMEQMEAGINPKSVNRKISSIKAYIRYMRKAGVISTNPAATLKSIKTPKILVSALGENELSDLLSADFFDETPQSIRARAIIELFYATGIRRSELINLKLSGIDVSQKTIRVIGKRNKERLIPLTNTAVQAINHYLSVRPVNPQTTFLFLTDKGKKLYPELVYATVKRYLSYVSSLQKKSPHVLRHTFATHLLNKGADMNDIKELMGHANLSATQVYTHNSFEQLKSVYNQSHPREAQSE